MSQKARDSRRRALRPWCDPLEERALLNAAMPTMGHPHAAAAVSTVHAARSHTVFRPIVPNLPATPDASFSTVPANGDINPYGVAFVPAGFPGGGLIHAGDVLVSNFNNSTNAQGTGTTIVDIGRNGQQSTFFTSQATGLSTALGVLKAGFVVVGNVPTTDGTFGTIGQGSLQILDRFGNVVAQLTDPNLLNGPWDLTINDGGHFAQLFVSNVNSGTVTRIGLSLSPRHDSVQVLSMTQIASGYATHEDDAALVVGPTGLAYDAQHDILYVASTADNAIFAIPHAGHTHVDNGTGSVVFADQNVLRGPLGLALAPNGDLLTTNGDAPSVNPDPSQPSELIEFTPRGQFVGELSLDPNQGAAFGLAVRSFGPFVTVATVNDVTNSLDLRTIRFSSSRR